MQTRHNQHLCKSILIFQQMPLLSGPAPETSATVLSRTCPPPNLRSQVKSLIVDLTTQIQHHTQKSTHNPTPPRRENFLRTRSPTYNVKYQEEGTTRATPLKQFPPSKRTRKESTRVGKEKARSIKHSTQYTAPPKTFPGLALRAPPRTARTLARLLCFGSFRPPSLK